MSQLIVLGVFAHPDDELAVAGTLANHSDEGHEVHTLFLTKGEGTSKLSGSKEDIKLQRVRQAKEANEVLGSTPHFLDIPDKYVTNSREHAELIAQSIKKIRPDIILTWGKPIRTGTGHPDHRNTHDLVVDAITYARFDNQDGLEPHRDRISLYTLQHHESSPQDLVFVDVSHQYDRIMQFLDPYLVTFGDWDVKQHKTNLLSYFGEYIRCKYAEAFRKLTWRTGRATLD